MPLCLSCLRNSVRELGRIQPTAFQQSRHLSASSLLRERNSNPNRQNNASTIPLRKLSQNQWSRERPKPTSFRRTSKDLEDPLNLANHVLGLVQNGERQEALNTVHKYSREQHVTVSWNHIIDNDVFSGRIGDAFKVFNDMKKRGQKPDGYTFSVLFRGLGRWAHYKQSLPRALALYHSMFAENSPVRPTTIHTNAILNVCARAEDPDAIFSITARLPNYGPGSPDHVTYTTIFNCLRQTAWGTGKIMRDESMEEKTRRRHVAVIQGRKIWLDVLDRWAKGLIMDEKMVCAMGRLLLLGGSDRDCDDVLSLVEQTMLIPRELPRIGDPARKVHLRALQIPEKDAAAIAAGSLEDHSTTSGQGESVDQESPNTTVEDESQLLTKTEDHVDIAPPAAFDKTRIYATPGQNTISLIVDACTRMNAVKPAHAYWSKLTQKIQPDLENYHTYLRLLRVSRSSSIVLELLQDMNRRAEDGGLDLKTSPKTYTIALSSCVRNGNSRSSLDHATAILNMMQDVIEDPEIRAAEIFEALLSKKSSSWTLAQMRNATNALMRLWNNAQSAAAYGAWSPDTQISGGALSDGELSERDWDSNEYSTRVQPNTARVVVPNFRHRLVGITKILGAQIQRMLNTFTIEMSEEEERHWKSIGRQVDIKTQRFEQQLRAGLARARQKKRHPFAVQSREENSTKNRDAQLDAS